MVHIVRFIKSQLEISRVDSFPIKEISLHTKARSHMISEILTESYVPNTYDVGFPGCDFPIGTCAPVHGAAQVCKVTKILQPPEPFGSLMNGRNRPFDGGTHDWHYPGKSLEKWHIRFQFPRTPPIEDVLRGMVGATHWIPGWWFGTFGLFVHIGIIIRGVETTNQYR
jgi:hypothetical protein